MTNKNERNNFCVQFLGTTVYSVFNEISPKLVTDALATSDGMLLKKLLTVCSKAGVRRKMRGTKVHEKLTVCLLNVLLKVRTLPSLVVISHVKVEI